MFLVIAWTNPSEVIRTLELALALIVKVVKAQPNGSAAFVNTVDTLEGLSKVPFPPEIPVASAVIL